jgi:hypothetical protein
MGIMMNLIKKRGRPPKVATNQEAAAAFKAHEENIQRMIEERKTVHWEEVASKQELEISVLRMENEELARICVQRYEEIDKWKFVIKYLEKQIADLKF